RPDRRCVTAAVRTATVRTRSRVGSPTSLLNAAVPDDPDLRLVGKRLRQLPERRELAAANDDKLLGVHRVSGSMARDLRMHALLLSKPAAKRTSWSYPRLSI